MTSHTPRLTLRGIRQSSAPIAFVVLVTYLLALAPARAARAEASDQASTRVAPPRQAPVPARRLIVPQVQPGGAASSRADTTATIATASDSSEPPSLGDTDVASLIGQNGAQAPQVSSSLPSGPTKTGVSAQTIVLPSGPGTISGMGESFSAQLSTGIATFSVPLSLPSARGVAQPALGLMYISSGGEGVAGLGWSIGTSFIARQTDRGVPKYVDPAPGEPWNPEQDRFVFNGGQELVPICLVGESGQCPPGEVMPAWASGWRYFRPRVEHAFQRFFWSPDLKTWRVQGKGGDVLELGVPLDGSGDMNALEVDPTDDARIFRWNVSRAFDAHVDADSTPTRLRPLNIVAYRYTTIDGAAYLTDIYDTPPASGAADAQRSAYAHHTRLSYRIRPDVTFGYRRGWRTSSTQRLVGVDVTSMNFTGTGHRELVRRYHLSYDAALHVSLLTGLKLEGRCATAVAENGNESLPDDTNCPDLPAMSFGYQHVQGASDLPGYEPFDDRVRDIADSPPHSLDESLTSLFDVDADGLPDVVVAAPANYGGYHGVYFNGGSGGPAAFGPAKKMGVIPAIAGDDTNNVSFKNPNISVQDLDGNGVADLVHMPKLKNYGVYSPAHIVPPPQPGVEWWWVGQPVVTASHQDAKIDFTNRSDRIRVMDANGDGLVDVVFTSDTDIQTFFSLGRYPKGTAQFGRARWTGPDAAEISNDPVVFCLPWSATPASFDKPDILLADMNADGLPDIVRLRSGDLRYWPGRGNGFWGTGKRDDCLGGQPSEGRDIVMDHSPAFGTTDGSSLLLDDVNGDGLADLVEVRFNAVDIYLNVDGVGWTDRHVIANTPARPAAVNRVRAVDINGSGTRDILWGDGGGYRFIDLQGGVRPWVLNRVANGLGKTTDIEYTTSTSMMLEAAAAKDPWTSTAPMVVHVVRKVSESDNLGRFDRGPNVKTTEYAYRDPVYDGRQQEFRGFRHAEVKELGNAAAPTSLVSSTFLLGECLDDNSTDGVDPCTDRWRDNPREALKGLPTTSEQSDGAGVYSRTEHTAYRIRKLYQGLDGREVRNAFASRNDQYIYDTSSLPSDGTTVDVDDVELETQADTWSPSGTSALTIRSSQGMAHLRSDAHFDRFGDGFQQVDHGCVAGCTQADERIETHRVFDFVAGDTGGWLRRIKEHWIEGEDQVRRRHFSTSYDSKGDLVDATAEVLGTLELDRFHETPGAQGDGPTSTSVDGTFPTNHREYDSFGNLTLNVTAGNRCTRFGYEPAFKQLPASETTFVGDLDPDTSCGKVQLTASATYDRGLGSIVDNVGWHGEPSHVDYDGFGRLVQTIRPDPHTPQTLSAAADGQIEYLLADTSHPSYSIIHRRVHVGSDASQASYAESWEYVDGLGRTILRLDQSDPSDDAPFVANGPAVFGAKGRPERMYAPWFYRGEPQAFPILDEVPSLYSIERRDAFDRTVETTQLDGTIAGRTVYHALSKDSFDAADLAPGPHQGTPETKRQDGHGRLVSTIVRVHVGTSIDQRETRMTYLPTNELARVEVVHVGTSDPPVVRWLAYDTLGRMVLNVEPNASRNFVSTPGTVTPNLKAWRYAYNHTGDLVGTSDPRGCGVNYFYDTGGRVTAEDYSPCLNTQQPYSRPDFATRTGLEVSNHYDDPDPDVGTIADAAGRTMTVNLSQLKGRLVSSSDRSSKSVMRYDQRGRITGLARKVARPGIPADHLADRYAPRWYLRTFDFDAANRVTRSSTGATSAALMGQDGESAVTSQYGPRGPVSTVGSSYGTLVQSTKRDADALPSAVVYGDAAHTQRALSYDDNRRLVSLQVFRGAPVLWSDRPAPYQPPNASDEPSQQLLLDDADVRYDAVGNIVEIRDWRIAGEWPGGARPTSRKFEYDDLYQVTQTTYAYQAGDDGWTSPLRVEDGQGQSPTLAPHVSFSKRIHEERFQYDWRGNKTQSTDDVQGFYDRSLGVITSGAAAGAKPHQLLAASNRALPGGTTDRRGDLSTSYDDGGNLTDLTLHRDGPCLPQGASCSQRFVYRWDEVGRLAAALRWDLTTPERTASATNPHLIPGRDPDARVEYAYDDRNERVRKSTSDAAGAQVHDLHIFESLELRNAPWDEGASAADYAIDANIETIYLLCNGRRMARIVYEPDSPSAGASPHVFLEIADYLGSTSIVVDKDTSELVERVTYSTYGWIESDYRPGRWNGFRERYQFSGKETEVDVGLVYFGQRFYSPYLGTWISPDPLALHAPTADVNLYRYAEGRPTVLIDADGLFVETLLVAALIGFVIGAGREFVGQQLQHPGSVNWREVLAAGVIGAAAAFAGGAFGFGAGSAAGALQGSSTTAAVLAGGAAVGATETVVEAALYNEKVDPWKLLLNATMSAASAAANYWGKRALADNSKAFREYFDENPGFRTGNPGVDVAAQHFNYEGPIEKPIWMDIKVSGKENDVEWQKQMQAMWDKGEDPDPTWLLQRTKLLSEIGSGVAQDRLAFEFGLGGTQENKHGDPSKRTSCKGMEVTCVLIGAAIVAGGVAIYLGDAKVTELLKPTPGMRVRRYPGSW
jgi:RHS repeat-associated protein